MPAGLNHSLVRPIFRRVLLAANAGNVQLDMYADFFSKTASVYTGIVGVIIGYYFGRSVDRNTKPGELNNGATVTTTDH